ncbi:hypothetical protein RJ639_021073 [Escallonia herrerae]|uniref:SKP1-like protein n=1 Tax=Escallonia herrerae TaxID=1293975 RepID=A0AA88V4R4_9ASTE|nr:hypothetical protein RJ639_021073 [Escallonia herrerae]
MSSSAEKNMLTLKTSDGQEFEVEESVMLQSETIKSMVDDGCDMVAIPLPNVDSKTLVTVLEYCKRHAAAGSSEKEEEELKAFDQGFLEGMKKDTLFELLLAANYLEIKGLMETACLKVADNIKDMMPEEVREYFCIENDFTPEEEAEIRKEHEWAFDINSPVYMFSLEDGEDAMGDIDHAALSMNIYSIRFIANMNAAIEYVISLRSDELLRVILPE